MIKIVITGPECTGKSTLAVDLSEYYKVPYIPEYARTFLENLKREYTEQDLITIALGQVDEEQKVKPENLLICDTDLLVIKIWSQVKYGRVDPRIQTLLEQSKPNLYILPHFDIPYEEDDLREHPEGRAMLYDYYIEELNKGITPWIAVSGDRAARVIQAVSEVDSLISLKS